MNLGRLVPRDGQGAAGAEAPFSPSGAGAEDAALSLATSRGNGEWVSGLQASGCERRVVELRDAGSNRIYLAGCGAWVCPVCGPRKARRYAEAIAAAHPTTFGRLSLMPESWEETRSQVRDLRRRLSNRYGSVEWAWVRHRNPQLTGYHVHFVGRLPWIPQRELQGMTGGRIPWIQKAKQELGSADYLLGVRERHGASGYLLKRAARPEFWLDHLELNGGRGVHWSRGFFGEDKVEDVLHAVRASHRSGNWYVPGRGPRPLDPMKRPVSIPERTIDKTAVAEHDPPRLFERG